MAEQRVAVLGAGVMGLSTAVCLQESGMDCHVTLIAEAFSPDTTSDVSGGFWGLNLQGSRNQPLLRYVGRTTYDYLKALALSPQASTVGARLLSGFYFHQTEPEEFGLMEKIVDDFRRLSPDELRGQTDYCSGFSYTAPVIDVMKYLGWLMQRFKQGNGKIVCRKIEAVEELIGQWDVVVNCSGLGAAQLFRDIQMYPVKGQIIRLEAPWINHFYFFRPTEGRTTYILPGPNFVVIGGTANKGDWSTDVKSDDETDIWQRAVHNLPELRNAKKIKSCVGLRPCRPEFRLEPEVLGHGRQALRVVHNYGHGGSGICLHWGCAQVATSMVSDFLNSVTRESALPLHKL